jgi:hypothetical protein
MSQPDILTISSYNSIETQTASNFEAMLPNAIVNPKRMILNKFVMPNLMYDISPNYNKLAMTWFHGGIQYPLTVNLSTQTHWSSGSDFASYLLVLINTQFLAINPLVGSPLTSITYSTSTGKLTFDMNGIFTLKITPWNSPDPITAASAWYKLGFTGTSGVGYSSFTAINANFTGDSPLILLSTSIIYVSISLLGNSLNDRRDSSGTVTGDDTIYGCVPVNADFGQVIIYGDQFGSFVSTNVNTVRSIRVRLLNEEYNELVLPQNCFASMEFRLEY